MRARSSSTSDCLCQRVEIEIENESGMMNELPALEEACILLNWVWLGDMHCIEIEIGVDDDETGTLATHNSIPSISCCPIKTSSTFQTDVSPSLS